MRSWAACLRRCLALVNRYRHEMQQLPSKAGSRIASKSRERDRSILSQRLATGSISWHVGVMPMRGNRSIRCLKAGSALAWLSLVLALLQPYDRPPQRSVQSDSGQWFQLADIAGWLCLPTGSPNDETPHSGVEPFCGLCVMGGTLQAAVPEASTVVGSTQCGYQAGSWPIEMAADHRIGDRPPARAPPSFVRLT